MPSMSGKGKHQVITTDEEDEGTHPNRCSPLEMNDHQSSSPLGSQSPHRLKNIALSDMLSEFQDEGISSPPADLATFNSSEEASILYAGECMEMNNDILDLTKPLPWDRLKKGNSSMSLDSLNDNYIESQGDGTGSSEKPETNEDGEVCTCGENVSPGCPVHREKALLTEEIQRTCSTMVENLMVETPNDNVTLGLMRQKPREEDRIGDIYSSLESREFDTAARTRSNPRTLDVSSSFDRTDRDSYSTNSTTGSLKLDSKGSQSTDKDASSTNSSSGSFRSVPSVHKSDLSSSPESYDLLYKSFEVASMMEKEEEEEEEDDSPTVTPLEMFNRASPKLQKALTEKQRLALEGAHSENERNAAMESSGMCNNMGLSSRSANQPSCESLTSDPGQKVTTFAQLAKTRKKPEIIQAPKSLTIKPTHWSELVANQEKNKTERSASTDDSLLDTPKRPHSLPIQLRFITKPAIRPTQTPEQNQPAAGSVIRGVTRTLSAPEGFGVDGMPVESHAQQQPEMTRTTSWGQQSQTNAPTGNFTRFGMHKATSLPAPPSDLQTHIEFDPYQSTQFGGLQRSQPAREYSPSMDINANFTDDDLEGSISCDSPPEEFRIHDYTQRQQRSPPESLPSKPKRCVSWSDFPEGCQPISMQQNGMTMEQQRFARSFSANTTTFRKMAATTSSTSPPDLVDDDVDYQCLKDMDSTPSWYRVRSATIGSRVSLKDLWKRIEEDSVGDYESPAYTSWNGASTRKPVTTWAKTTQQQHKISDIERNSVGCQVSDISPEVFGEVPTKLNSFEAMLAENGLCGPELQSSCSGLNHHIGMGQNLSDNAPWFVRPRSKTFLSLHKDTVRTLQNVRSVKYEPRVKTWLVDCNQTKPSRVTCEDTFNQEQRTRRLVRIENITDTSDVKYIRHRPLKPIHVVDAEYQRRKALQQLNALEAPTSAPPTVRYAPSFGKFIASDNYQSLPPNLERYRHWLNHDGQSQLPKDSNQPIRQRLASESAADMHRVFSGNEMQQSHMQQRPHSLVLASYCDDGMESLPPQEIPVSPRYIGHYDTVDMLRKRAIVAAIDGAVDHILGHFAHAINKSPLEKVRLGDSQQTPNVGHIVLHYLCPAIADLLLDGLKPHMQSFIVGRVKTTVWTPVEATTRLGPGTRSLYELVTMISKKRILKEPSMKTNAFIFGLLNTRNIEVWLEHIRSHPDIVRTLYEPEAFLSLCNTSTRQLFDKLLLALQPLAILPFNLDYQFEYNYMQQHAAVREKQQLLEQHARYSSPHRREPIPKEQRQSPEGRRSSGRFSSLLGRGTKTELTKSSSWTSSLSSSLGWGKSSADQSSGRGQHQSSEQSDSDRLLRTVNAPPPKDTSTQNEELSSAASTPTSSQSWSLDWIKSFVAATDQSQDSKTVESPKRTTAKTATASAQSVNTGSSWSRLGASMFKAFDRMRHTEPQQQSITKQPELVKIDERPPSPVTTPSSPHFSEPWNTASPGSPMKALCHYATMSPGELSFSKGDILTVDHQVDPDWILCHHGNESGLVHIDYVQGLE